MTFDLQNVVALAIVGAAASYIAWRVVRMVRSSRGGKACGRGCGSCGSEPSLVTITMPNSSETNS